jgi:UDP:flavonoid glycosyltransferase YjiC (YdhE family)
MSRILFTTQPALSHLGPMLPVARALEDRGHDVAVACAPSFVPLVGRLGLRAFACGADYRVGEECRLVPSLRRARQVGDREYRYTGRVLVKELAGRMLPDLLSVAAAWRPALVVRDCVELAACVVAEARGIPVAVGRENRFLAPETWEAEAGPELAELRLRAGLAPEPAVAMLDRHLSLAPAVPALVTATASLPEPREFGCHLAPTLRFLRPVPSFQAPPDEPAIDLDGEAPLVYASLGTVYNNDSSVLRAIVDAARGAPFRLLLATGPDLDPGLLEPPANVTVRRWVSQRQVLERSDAAVVAGGFGTVCDALAAGIPLAFLPLGADHATNALRCATLGVGVTVAPGRRTPRRIRAVIERALADPSLRERASALSETVGHLPGPEAGAEWLEELIAGADAGLDARNAHR